MVRFGGMRWWVKADENTARDSGGGPRRQGAQLGNKTRRMRFDNYYAQYVHRHIVQNVDTGRYKIGGEGVVRDVGRPGP